MPGTPAIPREGLVDDLRSRILEAAIQQFASVGYAATSMREIVESVGCTKPALYYYFNGKAALFKAAVERAHERIGEVEGADEPARGLREHLRIAFASLARNVKARPDDLRLLFRAQQVSGTEPAPFDSRQLREEHVSQACALLQAGIDAGDVRPDLPVEDAAISLMGMLHFELQLLLDGRPLADDFADRILSIFMDGVGR